MTKQNTKTYKTENSSMWLNVNTFVLYKKWIWKVIVAGVCYYRLGIDDMLLSMVFRRLFALRFPPQSGHALFIKIGYLDFKLATSTLHDSNQYLIATISFRFLH